MGPPITGLALAHALEHIAAATFLVSGRGGVVLANRAGSTWLAADRGHPQLLARPGGPDPVRFAVTAFANHYLAVLRGPGAPVLARWGLTARETDVAYLICRGATNRQIAHDLGCALKTVEHHVSAILRKAHLENRAGLILAILEG